MDINYTKYSGEYPNFIQLPTPAEIFHQTQFSLAERLGWIEVLSVIGYTIVIVIIISAAISFGNQD